MAMFEIARAFRGVSQPHPIGASGRQVRAHGRVLADAAVGGLGLDPNALPETGHQDSARHSAHDTTSMPRPGKTASMKKSCTAASPSAQPSRSTVT